ncbi:uncharacterized protein LOC128331358 [Hemicordylus capensis]|uniref:uncharacterized protein LOC128331358 n=1 Tax=Hemicordylus capensis TaxID=884348 RepID=UPI00230322CD|nr:uncharacterized protein LOC128331358 [Hemicordylus capensis]
MEVGVLKDKEDSEPLENNKKHRTGIQKLFYISNISRPYISSAVGRLHRRVDSPAKKNLNAVKRIGQYSKRTADFELLLLACKDAKLIGYMDANWAEDQKDRKSTSCYAFFNGGEVITWMSRKQSIAASSSTEAEYISVAQACQEVWLHKLLEDFKINEAKPTIMYEDN